MTDRLRFPAPLQRGDLIAVTAPSSGVAGPGPLARLDLVIAHLRARGFRVVEGDCLRAQHLDQSASADLRAAEFSRFLHDPEVRMVLPPWGGERAIELLWRLDFDALRALPPKWVLGYSDTSTLLMPLTLCAGWATAHGPNLMDLAPTQTDPLTTGTLDVLMADLRTPVEQAGSPLHQRQWTPFETRFDAPLVLTEPSAWWRLDGLDAPLRLSGRLIGGCLDTVAALSGSAFGDVPAFIRRHAGEGTLLYLENCEMSPQAMLRALGGLRLSGWFDGVSGVLLGRSAAAHPHTAGRLDERAALQAVLGDLDVPVVCDVDIGHRPPQFTLINGARATLFFEGPRGRLIQQA